MQLDLRLLRYFVAVADEGQITRAAAKLNVGQPALSQSIALLESKLGVTLLQRHARGVGVTPAGQVFLEKARVAISATTDAESAAQSLARAARHAIEWGFIASPPMVAAPELFGAFAAARPDVEVTFRELPFPRGSTAAWLAGVDVAIGYALTDHPDVRTLAIRTEPRVVLLARSHRLAQRRELTVAEVLDETFCGNHPAVEPVRAGFWSLDDHRGGPPAHLSSDRATSPQEVLACIATGRAISTAPAPSVANVLKGLSDVLPIPLTDAKPAVLMLAWLKDNPNEHVEALASLADQIADDRSSSE